MFVPRERTRRCRNTRRGKLKIRKNSLFNISAARELLTSTEIPQLECSFARIKNIYDIQYIVLCIVRVCCIILKYDTTIKVKKKRLFKNYFERIVLLKFSSFNPVLCRSSAWKMKNTRLSDLSLTYTTCSEIKNFKDTSSFSLVSFKLK